ncbi:hypothetical protein FS837_008714, partial [Tulasnella sp. UAMH 9824]
MADLYQLFTKDYRNVLEPLEFFIHARRAEAKRIIRRHGGVVVDTKAAAEIIVANPDNRTFGVLTTKYALAGNKKTVESLESIEEWVKNEHVVYACVKRRRTGGRKPGT